MQWNKIHLMFAVFPFNWKFERQHEPYGFYLSIGPLFAGIRWR